MKNNNNNEGMEELPQIENNDEGNIGCQVRRKIEDYLEHRRYKDELGELEDQLDFGK